MAHTGMNLDVGCAAAANSVDTGGGEQSCESHGEDGMKEQVRGTRLTHSAGHLASEKLGQKPDRGLWFSWGDGRVAQSGSGLGGGSREAQGPLGQVRGSRSLGTDTAGLQVEPGIREVV